MYSVFDRFMNHFNLNHKIFDLYIVNSIDIRFNQCLFTYLFLSQYTRFVDMH